MLFLFIKFAQNNQVVRKKLILLILTITFWSCNKRTEEKNTKKNNFTIDFSLKGTKKNQVIFLKKQENGISYKIDSTYLKNGKASFSGKIDLPQVYGIFIKNNKQGIFPIIEKGKIIIEANINTLYNSKITGTKLNNQLNQYKTNAHSISAKMNELFHEFQKARAQNNSRKIKEINLKLDTINNELNKFKIDFVKQNTDSFVASMVLFSLAKNKEVNYTTIQSLYNSLSQNVKQSEFSKNIEVILSTHISIKNTIK